MIMVWCLPLLRDGGDFNFKKHKFIGGGGDILVYSMGRHVHIWGGNNGHQKVG